MGVSVFKIDVRRSSLDGQHLRITRIQELVFLQSIRNPQWIFYRGGTSSRRRAAIRLPPDLPVSFLIAAVPRPRARAPAPHTTKIGQDKLPCPVSLRNLLG